MRKISTLEGMAWGALVGGLILFGISKSGDITRYIENFRKNRIYPELIHLVDENGDGCSTNEWEKAYEVIGRKKPLSATPKDDLKYKEMEKIIGELYLNFMIQEQSSNNQKP